MVEQAYIFMGNVFLTAGAGTSTGSETFKAFLGFMFLVVGIIVTFTGIIHLSTAKHDWQLFYAPQDDLAKQNSTLEKKKKARRKGFIILGIGILFLILSIFF